ncbi:hypothetical protein B5J94_12715, partial [Moraxella lacunata]
EVFKNPQKSGFGKKSIDKSGKVVIPLIFDYAGEFVRGMAEVKQNGKYGYIDKTGSIVIPTIYDKTERLDDELIEVEQNDKSGMIDNTGKEVLPIEYDYIRDFSDTLMIIKHHDKFGVFYKPEQTILPTWYDDITEDDDGLAVFWRHTLGFLSKIVYKLSNGKFGIQTGYFDSKDNEISPNQHHQENIQTATSNLAMNINKITHCSG